MTALETQYKMICFKNRIYAVLNYVVATADLKYIVSYEKCSAKSLSDHHDASGEAVVHMVKLFICARYVQDMCKIYSSGCVSIIYIGTHNMRLKLVHMASCSPHFLSACNVVNRCLT